MTPKTAIRQTNPDADLVARTGRGDHAAFEALMRRYNGRLFRVARAILKDDSEAEDAVQDAYLEAFRHIGEYRGEAQVSTWLTRIAINQALMRRRRHKRERDVLQFPGNPVGASGNEGAMMDRRTESPATTTLRAEIRKTVERRIDELPATFRAVFVMRDVEEMTVQETADCLGVPSATVRTRLFRARALLRDALARDVDSATLEVFGFAGERCDRIIQRVFAALSSR